MRSFTALMIMLQSRILSTDWCDYILSCRKDTKRKYCQRPYCVECTGSHLNSEVKPRKARIVLGWVTAREVLRVLLTFLHFDSVDILITIQTNVKHEIPFMKCFQRKELGTNMVTVANLGSRYTIGSDERNLSWPSFCPTWPCKTSIWEEYILTLFCF